MVLCKIIPGSSKQNIARMSVPCFWEFRQKGTFLEENRAFRRQAKSVAEV